MYGKGHRAAAADARGGKDADRSRQPGRLNHDGLARDRYPRRDSNNPSEPLENRTAGDEAAQKAAQSPCHAPDGAADAELAPILEALQQLSPEARARLAEVLNASAKHLPSTGSGDA